MIVIPPRHTRVRIARLLILLMMMFGLCNCKSLDAQTADEEAAILNAVASGTVRLECSFACSHDYIFQQRKIYGLYATGEWRALAVAIYKTQFRKDISYYLLGVASQGLGYHDAALKYFRYAGALATSPIGADRCASTNLCFDVRLPDAIYPRMRASEFALVRVPNRVPSISAPTTSSVRSATPQPSEKEWIDPPPALR